MEPALSIEAEIEVVEVGAEANGVQHLFSLVWLTCPPKTSPVVELDWKLERGVTNVQEVLQAGADYQQAS
jgi:hypothetical protein